MQPGEHERPRGEQVDLEALQSPLVDRLETAIDELERTLVLAGRIGGSCGVRPAPVGEIGAAGASNRLTGRDRRWVGVDEALWQIVKLPGHTELREEPLGILDTARDRLRPCDRG